MFNLLGGTSATRTQHIPVRNSNSVLPSRTPPPSSSSKKSSNSPSSTQQQKQNNKNNNNVDTSNMSTTDLDSLSGELARKNRVSRLAAAMRAMHESKMQQMDAQNFDEVPSDDTDEMMFQSLRDGGGGDRNYNNNVGKSSQHDTSMMLQQQQQYNPLKFHAVGWKRDQEDDIQHSAGSLARKRRPAWGAHPHSTTIHPSSSSSATRNRVIASNEDESHHEGNDEDNNDDLEDTDFISEIVKSPPRLQGEDENEKDNKNKKKTVTAGSGTSAARARALQNVSASRRRNFQQKQQKEKEEAEKLKQQQEKEKQEQLETGENKTQEELEKEKEELEKKRKEALGFAGRTESEQFYNAAVQLRNINLQLKVMFEKRYRSRLADDLEGEDAASVENKSRSTIAAILAGAGGGGGGDNDIADEATMAGAARLGLALEQRDKELADSQRLHRQAALDAELLTGELLRSNATIERYKLYLDEMTVDNEALKTELENTRKELFKTQEKLAIARAAGGENTTSAALSPVGSFRFSSFRRGKSFGSGDGSGSGGDEAKSLEREDEAAESESNATPSRSEGGVTPTVTAVNLDDPNLFDLPNNNNNNANKQNDQQQQQQSSASAVLDDNDSSSRPPPDPFSASVAPPPTDITSTNSGIDENAVLG